MNKIKILINNNYFRVSSGIILGAIAGFLVYYYIGCQNGSCAITSNPYISIAAGSVIGVLSLIKEK